MAPDSKTSSPQPALLLRGATVIDPAAGREKVADILIRDGVIERIGRRLPVNGSEVWELTGKYIAPGVC